MSSRNAFEQRCEALFAQKLGLGRRWKTACAQSLAIGRATLYRYFEDDKAVPADVLQRLTDLEAPSSLPGEDSKLVKMYASALVEVQKQIDDSGWLHAPYPKVLRRAFDLGAAANFCLSKDVWPTNLETLMAKAATPLFDWVPDLSWDVSEEFFSSRLVEDGEITTDCRKLAVVGGNPEVEIEENIGYEIILSMCMERADGEELYRTWRRAVIENPVVLSWSSTLMNYPLLGDVERLDEIVEAFYQRVPETLAIDGYLPICTVSGTILRRLGDQGFHTECRDPEAIKLARAGQHQKLKYRPGMLQLRRAFRTFWCLPGKAELELFKHLNAAGWQCQLWPSLDRVDLVAASPDGGRKIAVDVKDYLSPANLASRFNGFKEFSATHECYLVCPDYVLEIDDRFESKFNAFRASLGKNRVLLRSVGGILNELGVK